MSRTTEKFAEALEQLIGDTVEHSVAQQFDDYEPEIDADNVTGLERFIENIIDDHEHEVKAANVDGLEDEIDERMAVILNETLEDAVNEILNTSDGYRVNPQAIAESFNDPAVKAALDVALKESLLRVLTQLWVSPVPMATPVVAPVITPVVPVTPVQEQNN